MSLAKKSPVAMVPTRNLKKTLEHLYARRSAVDTLIQSLEDYDRFRVARVEDAKRQTA